MTLPRELLTERLELRAFELRDARDVFRYARDPEWARFLPVPQPYLREHAEAFVEAQVRLDWCAHLAWAICLLGEPRAVGGVNLRWTGPTAQRSATR